jgi:hypothetical protein
VASLELLAYPLDQLQVSAEFTELLTVVPLGNSVLNLPTLSHIRDLGPVFIWICRAAESTDATVAGAMPRRRSCRV